MAAAYFLATTEVSTVSTQENYRTTIESKSSFFYKMNQF